MFNGEREAIKLESADRELLNGYNRLRHEVCDWMFECLYENRTYINLQLIAGVAQLVEHQPSKLRVAGSSLVSRSI